MVAQISGALLASFVLREVLNPIQNLGTTTPGDTAMKALVMEIVVTFCMMFVTSAVATDTRAVSPFFIKYKIYNYYYYYYN